MKIQIIYQYKSRKNSVQLCRTDNGIAVWKRYLLKEACARELLVYEKIRSSEIPHAEVIQSDDLSILMTYLPGRNLVDVLEEQEQSGYIDWSVWKKLVKWLIGFYGTTGLVMTDINLRNFLYHADTQTVYGIDFEECAEDDLITTVARLAAYIRNYTPENTQIKREIAEYVMLEFCGQQNVELHTIFLETEKEEAFLLKRRKNRT